MIDFDKVCYFALENNLNILIKKGNIDKKEMDGNKTFSVTFPKDYKYSECDDELSIILYRSKKDITDEEIKDIQDKFRMMVEYGNCVKPKYESLTKIKSSHIDFD